MREDVSEALFEELEKNILYPVSLIELEFEEGVLGLWTGYGVISWSDKIFYGGGALLKIETAAETQTLEAQNTRIQLSGIPEIVSAALNTRPRGRPARVWSGFINPAAMPAYDPDTNSIIKADELIMNPVREFTGKMDSMPLLDDPTNPVITLNAESDLVMLTRPNERRYTHEDQQIDYPGDRFFEYVPQMQDAEVAWGD